MKILKDIKDSPFKYPKKKFYLGRLKYGTPYFYPINFNKNIISFRKLILKSKSELQEEAEKYPYRYDRCIYKNLPLVRRNKDWIFKIFGNHYWLSIGYPIAIDTTDLGWKDKFESPRHEWNPALQIFIFHWQFCIWWKSPDGDNDHTYYEMFLWYKYYNERDIIKAEKTWGWINTKTKQSTWNNNYLKK